MQERRKFIRFNVPIEVRYRAPQGAIEGSSLSRDFSREGIGLTLNERLAHGATLGLEMSIPGEIAPIIALGQVAWVKETGAERRDRFDAGIKLTRISPFDKSKLLEYVYKKWLNELRMSTR